MIDGPEGTPYDGGIFTIDIIFPPEYPFKAPKVKFETRIYHPNVKTDSGEICADLIQNGWAPTLNLRHVLCTIQQVKGPTTHTTRPPPPPPPTQSPPPSSTPHPHTPPGR